LGMIFVESRLSWRWENVRSATRLLQDANSERYRTEGLSIMFLPWAEQRDR
jgi:hypothetical protein